jgi:lipid-binding SYLF domain-containing protein
MKKLILALVVAAPLLAAGCSTAPKTDEDRAALSSDVATTLGGFKADDPSLQKLLDQSAGWAVLPNVGKAAVGVGGAYGKGEVFEKGARIGHCDMTQGSIGLQLGGQGYSELIVFSEQANLDNFKQGDFSLSANVSAVAANAGAAKTADTTKGIVVFVRGQKGLMAEASVGGQKFRFVAE